MCHSCWRSQRCFSGFHSVFCASKSATMSTNTQQHARNVHIKREPNAPVTPCASRPRPHAPSLACAHPVSHARAHTPRTQHPPFPRVTATHARQTHQRAYLPTHQHTYPPPQKAHKSFVHSNARPYTRNAYVINQRVRGRVRHIRCFQCLYTKANHKSQVQTHTKRTLNAPSLYLTHPPKRVRIHAQRAH